MRERSKHPKIDRDALGRAGTIYLVIFGGATSDGIRATDDGRAPKVQ
jgi:hypothetical protein